MKTIAKILGVLLVLFVALFLALNIAWLTQPKRMLNVFILDKTVPYPSCPEHSSLTWLLNHLRLVGPDGQVYRTAVDYWGFMPMGQLQFDFRSVRIHEIDAYSAAFDMAYYADCYGVHAFEWYKDLGPRQHSSTSKVYGGLNQNDFLLLKRMQEGGKLIIGEHNMLNAPTNALIRNKAEELFNLSYSGWSGRYYPTLDTATAGGPPIWMVGLYEAQHPEGWPAGGSGIVLLHNDSRIEVLLLDVDLLEALPTIEASAEGQQTYGLPATTPYSGWFEVMELGEKAVCPATFVLLPTEQGAQRLQQLGLPHRFPAIIQAADSCPTFYFCADFAENPTAPFCAKLRGGLLLNSLLNGNGHEAHFFQHFYAPLMQHLIERYTPAAPLQ